MSEPDPRTIVLEFNNCINTRNLEGLAALMADDYSFIDSSGDVHVGKEMMIGGWGEFFESYPDYRNHFEFVEERGNEVYILGYSTCSYDPLDGPAIWVARVEGELVAEWRIYLDTPDNRELLGLPV